MAKAQDKGITVPADILRQLVTDTFAAAGCSAEEAERIGRYLTASNLSGHESHGILRVPRYLHWLGEGNITRDQTITVASENDVLAVVDGNFGFGQTVGPQAVRLGMEKAAKNGLALIGLRNSGHLGRIGDWAEMAAAEGLISIHFVNTSGLGLLVAPFGGAERRLSTNPVCIGIPDKRGEPLVLDFATSIVAEGKVLNAHGGGKPLPEGALIDGDGALSTDPAEEGGEVLCPGDAEQLNRAQRLAEGVPLPSSTWYSLLDAATEAGMPEAEVEAARGAATTH